MKWVGEEGEKKEEAPEAEASVASSSTEEATPSTLKKAKTGDSKQSSKERGQKVITLKEEMDVRDRQDLHKQYLLYCMQGEVRKLGMGSSITLERDESEFARLIQLGDVLGLTEVDTMQIHQSLAEQAFKNQAQQMVSGSTLTPEKKEALKDLQTKLGLQDSVADSVIKGLVDKERRGEQEKKGREGHTFVMLNARPAVPLRKLAKGFQSARLPLSMRHCTIRAFAMKMQRAIG